MEYDQALVDRIMAKFQSIDLIGYTTEQAMVQRRLESFLPEQKAEKTEQLPPCPLCDGSIDLDMRQNDLAEDWFWFCTHNPCDVGSMDCHDTKQEAIDAYLATPYCKMYKENNTLLVDKIVSECSTGETEGEVYGTMDAETAILMLLAENKQVSKWMDEAHEYKVLCGKMAEVIRHAIRNCGCEANKGYYKEILKEYDATE